MRNQKRTDISLKHCCKKRDKNAVMKSIAQINVTYIHKQGMGLTAGSIISCRNNVPQDEVPHYNQTRALIDRIVPLA